jgi:hypothetical protein
MEFHNNTKNYQTIMDKTKYNLIVKDKANHKILVSWACDCADRVLSLFEKEYPDDTNPRVAILAGRMWTEGKLKIVDARKKAFAAHNSARSCDTDSAIFAARSAGHACATAHVATHAIHASQYALKAIKSSNVESEFLVLEEKTWQDEHLIELLNKP